VKEYATKMIGAKLVTKQTGAEGQLCSKVLVNEGIEIHRELYFAILMDRKHGGPVLVASTQGGMDIEEVAEKSPEAIITEPVDIVKGLGDAQARKLAERLGFTGPLVDAAVKQFKSLYALFVGSDATQVEINPLAEGSVAGVANSKTIFAVDAKLNFDDNAAFRQGEIYAQRDKSMEDPRDVAAEEAGLNYVGLDGTIGCMVNGAGLAMATMDIIKLHGGSPANFLDVGGGATAAQVTTAFKILTADPKVKAILVNIFGGIMRVRRSRREGEGEGEGGREGGRRICDRDPRAAVTHPISYLHTPLAHTFPRFSPRPLPPQCDTIATGIVQAAKDVGLGVPLVVRLEGTNVEQGKEILRNSGVKIITADNLDDAAIKAVQSLK
jgi:succinyl-CoA synthetase beta subunit